ncbi:DUF4773 domain-containing protein [Trichostrongylus colubriformis]|uniref:DUF4773 domain-containing protein n=1 Tax=Trichostrongylus colubriformis TaxID=6319 RepID=A0AAN8J2H8_TRICO
MLTILILCSSAAAVFSTKATVLKFGIRPDKVNIGTELPFEIDLLDNESREFRLSTLGLAKKWEGQLRGFAILKNISNALALIKFDNPELDQNTVAISLKNRLKENMKISTDQFRIVLSHSYATVVESEDLDDEENSCLCVHGNCACCVITKIPDFNHEICVNATYNRLDYGLDLSIGVDGHYYTMQISLRNPPPICLAIPFAHDLVDLCVAFKDLDISRTNRTLSGCVELEGELIHMRVLRLHLGCFVMPI